MIPTWIEYKGAVVNLSLVSFNLVIEKLMIPTEVELVFSDTGNIIVSIS